NAVTAANHLIGELFALVALHHAFGGDELDAAVAGSLKGEKSEGGEEPEEGDPLVDKPLEAAHELAKGAAAELPGFLKPSDQHYTELTKESEAEAAIGDALTRLKKVMTLAYVVHATGGVLWELKDVPFLEGVAAIGLALSAVATGFEWKVFQEALVLHVME